MKKLIAAYSFVLSLIFIASVAGQAQTPPSEAQIKKDVMNPGVIAIIFRGRGSFEKYVTNGAVVSEYYRAITVRRKTDKPGVTLDVIGDVVYRLVGNRWVYRTMRLSGNQYGGIKNPTLAEINQSLEGRAYDPYFHGNGQVIGEYESVRLADVPEWEWHTTNSVSFYAIAVYRIPNVGQSYSNADSPQTKPGVTIIDKVQEVWRMRIYRDDEKSPWRSATLTVVASLEIPGAKGEKIPRNKLLERKEYSDEEFKRMPRATRVPLLTQ
jgi:hypothetical protein